MISVRTRLIAFAPLVSLTLLTAAAAVGGYRTSGEPPAVAPAAASRTAPTATPAPDFGPSAPLPNLYPLLPDRAPANLGTARRAWDGAFDDLVDASSGTYSWTVYAGPRQQTFQSETGSFNLDPFQSRFDRTIPAGGGTSQVLHVRRLDGTAYVQFEDWGPWTGCWLRVTPEQYERLTGEDAGEFIPLPDSVLVISEAEMTGSTGLWFGPPFREYNATVSAAAALVFFGFNGKVIRDEVDRLLTIQVPITISLNSGGQLHGGGAHGGQVAAAISKSAPGLIEEALDLLRDARASFSLTGTGAPVSVPAPLPQSLLPFDADKDDTCAAKAPRA